MIPANQARHTANDVWDKEKKEIITNIQKSWTMVEAIVDNAIDQACKIGKYTIELTFPEFFCEVKKNILEDIIRHGNYNIDKMVIDYIYTQLVNNGYHVKVRWWELDANFDITW